MSKKSFQNLKSLVKSIIVNKLEVDMTIRVRGNSFQVDFVHGGVRYRRDHPTRQAAEECEIHAKANLLQGLDPFPDETPEQVEDPGKLFGAVCDDVYELVWSKQKSSRTTWNRMMQVRLDLGDDTPLTDLTTDVLDKYTIDLERNGNSPATVNRKLSIVSKVLKHAYRREELDRLPYIPRQGEPPTRFRWYTEEEQRLILEACKANNNPEFFRLIVVLFDTGMRISEALSLTRDNVLYDDNIIVLHEGETKNDGARSIPMTKRVAQLLRRVTHLNWFFSMNYDAACKEWNQIRSRIGMGKGDIMHAMRHTFCSRLSQNGTDLRTIQELAGHRDLSTTQRYTHLNTRKLKADIQKLEACTNIDDLISCDTDRDTTAEKSA